MWDWMGDELRTLQNLTVDPDVSKLDLSVVQALKRKDIPFRGQILSLAHLTQYNKSRYI